MALKNVNTAFFTALAMNAENIRAAGERLCNQTGVDAYAVLRPLGSPQWTHEGEPDLAGVWGVINSEGSIFFKDE